MRIIRVIALATTAVVALAAPAFASNYVSKSDPVGDAKVYPKYPSAHARNSIDASLETLSYDASRMYLKVRMKNVFHGDSHEHEELFARIQHRMPDGSIQYLVQIVAYSHQSAPRVTANFTSNCSGGRQTWNASSDYVLISFARSCLAGRKAFSVAPTYLTLWSGRVGVGTDTIASSPRLVLP